MINNIIINRTSCMYLKRVLLVCDGVCRRLEASLVTLYIYVNYNHLNVTKCDIYNSADINI